jgi:hypothetical protein
MSSRSLAAARAKRAGENAPMISGTRPRTSINSNAAFTQQKQPNYQQQQQSYGSRSGSGPAITNNVRIAKAPIQSQSQYQQNTQQNNNLPFAKLSVSDAVGLITLRLGRVEQYIIECENDKSGNTESQDGSKLFDTSVLNNIINRLDDIEKKETSVNNEEITKKIQEFSTISEEFTKINNEVTKHNLTFFKNEEKILKLERELIETKDLLKTFMMKYDVFVNETNEKFSDYEIAIAELEKNIPVIDESNLENNKEENENIVLENVISENNTENIEYTIEDKTNNVSLQNIDLKNLVEKELESIN